jgi:hypothetical protein
MWEQIFVTATLRILVKQRANRANLRPQTNLGTATNVGVSGAFLSKALNPVAICSITRHRVLADHVSLQSVVNRTFGPCCVLPSFALEYEESLKENKCGVSVIPSPTDFVLPTIICSGWTACNSLTPSNWFDDLLSLVLF